MNASEAAVDTAVETTDETDNEKFRFGHPPDLPKWSTEAADRLTEFEGVELVEVDFTEKAQRRRFQDVVLPIYAGDQNYIQPLYIHLNKFLDPKTNPAFAHMKHRAFIARYRGRDAGRMTVQIDASYNEYHETKAGFFGFFESIDDKKVAHAMLTEAIDWLRKEGITEVFGPTNFTMNHQAGLLIENFSRPPFVEETYNPEYYAPLFESFGFGKAKDLLVWWVDVENGMTGKNRSRIMRISERIKKKEGVTFRSLDLSQPEAERARIFDIYLKAWERNWGFAPMPKEEFEFLTEDLLLIAIPELVMFAEVDGEAVGFCATLPNVNEVMPRNGRLLPFGWFPLLTKRKKSKHARLYTLGTVPNYRKRGLEAVMFSETVVQAQKVGIVGGEIGWTLDDNDLINRAIISMDGKIDRRYRILGLELDD